MVTLQKRSSDYENAFLQLTIENKGSLDTGGSSIPDQVNEFRRVLEGRDGQKVALGNEELLRFLRAGAFVIENARVIFEKNEKYNKDNADLIAITFDMVQAVYEKQVIQTLRHREKEGRSKIILVNAKNWNPEESNLEHTMMAAWYLLNEILYSEETQTKGISLILDLSGVTMWQAARFVSHFTLKQVMRLLTFYESYPIKLKAIHTVNTPVVVSSTYAGFKYLLKKKIRDRINVHYCGPKVLDKYFAKDILPKSLEGSLPYDEAVDNKLMQSMRKRYARQLN